MIPKRIHTIWLSEDSTPEVVHLCNASKDKFALENGFTHILWTLDTIPRTSEYVQKCLEMKDWVRAADYLRLQLLEENGGIYLDADAQIVGNFDGKLGSRMFVFTEQSGYINNGYIGAEAGHPFLRYVLNTMEHSFRFDQNLFWTGMQFFAESYYIADREGLSMKIYNEDELKKIINHHAMKSWVKENDTKKENDSPKGVGLGSL